MKTMLSVFVACAVFASNAFADLVYVQEASIACDRSQIVLFFRDAPGGTKDQIEVRIGVESPQVVARYEVIAIRDRAKQREAITALLGILNDPANLHMDFRESIEAAGWKLR